MKALVTGASGFIGSHLCEELIRKGYRVTCLSRQSSTLSWIENLDIELVKGDCTDIETLRNIVLGFDYVFHLAGLTKATSGDAFYCINAKGTENLIQAVAENNPGLKRFVYLSSLAAAGPSATKNPICEDSPPSPVSDYGRSKLEGEKAVLRYAKTLPITILRPPAIYGPRDRDMLFVFKMIKKGVFFDLGKCYYSLLYVDDLVQGIILCAENTMAEGKIYFLCDTKFYTGKEIAMHISETLAVKAFPLRVPKFVMPFFAFIGERFNKQGIINRDRIKDFRHTYWICDAKKAREEIGFLPKVDLKEGIKWTADWYRIHRWL
ncbi:MAG: NAD(P)-dependent oxidoreductase [Thermodesulfovibrionales bacterium]|nr:NAD(P)-dependent oxidoreductase [Thermodesulfovibrionales bacterium]